MKNVLWKRFYAVMAFVSLVAAGSLTACSDNEDGYDSGVTGLTVPQELLSEGITVARSGGTATFAVQSLDAVQVSSSETWCTVQASAPSATLKAVTVTVTVQENTDVNDRTAIITLAAGSSSQQVNVKQTAADGLLVEAPAPVAAEGGTLEIALTTNGEPEVTCSVDWIARVQTKANMAERTYTFTVDKNESYSATDRIGRITFTLGTLTETVDATLLGHTTDDGHVTIGFERVPVSELLALNDGVLEKVYPTVAGEGGEGAENGGPIRDGHPGMLCRSGMGQFDDVIVWSAHA